MKKIKYPGGLNWLAYILLLLSLSVQCISKDGSQTENHLVPFGNYMNVPGDSNLFNTEYAENIDKSIRSMRDDQFHDTKKSVAQLLNTGVITNNALLETLQGSAPLTKGEPNIEVSAIRSLGICSTPTLDLKEPVIIEGGQFLAFAICNLGVLEKNENNETVFPDLPALERRVDAYMTLKALFDKALSRHDLGSINQSQKIALFERLFMASKFRKMSQTEFNTISESISKNGLWKTGNIFLINWYASYFYQNHLNYSKQFSPRYKSLQVSGNIINTKGDKQKGIFWQVAQNNYPSFLNAGVTAKKNPFLDFFNFQNTSNFAMQIYLPIKAKVNTSKNEIAWPENIKSIGILINAKTPFVYEIDNKPIEAAFDRAGTIQNVEIPIPTKVNEWPRESISVNNQFKNLDFKIKRNRNVAGCQIPSFSRENSVAIVNGHSWQRFGYCVFNTSAFDTVDGIEYTPLGSARAGLEYTMAMAKHYAASDYAILDGKVNSLSRLYRLVTFKDPSTSTLAYFKTESRKMNLNQLLTMLLEAWYFSTEYKQHFDFSKASYSGKQWAKFSGKIENRSKTSVNGEVTLLHSSGVSIASAQTTQGKYEIKTLIDGSIRGQNLTLKINANGYATQDILIKAASGLHINNFMLNELGKATNETAGIVKSAKGDVIINIPAGAVDEPKSFSTSSLVAGYDQHGKREYKFNVNPGGKFHKPVRFSIKPEASVIKELLKEGENIALFYLHENGKRELLMDSSYNIDKGIITASTLHFSSFVLGQCKIIECGPPAQKHSRSEIIERRHIEYPTQLPQLINDAQKLLKAGGWNEKDYNNISVPNECKSGSCAPLKMNLNLSHLNIPPSLNAQNVTIEKIELLYGKVQGVAHLDVQVEQCKINPTASLPQLRLNSIHSINSDLSFTLRFNPVDISYGCPRERTVCFSFFCTSIKAMQTCQDKFTHSVNVSVTGHKQQVINVTPNADSVKPVFKLGATFSEGRIDVQVPQEFQINERREQYAKYLKAILRNRLTFNRKILNTKVSETINSMSAQNPNFNDANCYKSGKPGTQAAENAT